MSEPKVNYTRGCWSSSMYSRDSEHAQPAAKSSALEQALRQLEIAKKALNQIASGGGEDWPWTMAEQALKELDDA